MHSYDNIIDILRLGSIMIAKLNSVNNGDGGNTVSTIATI